MIPKKQLLLTLLLSCALLLSGCFGAREIDDLAMVMAVGIDKGEAPNTVRVTAQIARPADVRGQTGAPSAGTGEPIWTSTGEGKSIFEAIRNIARYSSRRVFWAHNQVIVINEDLAREGIADIIDFFSRNHELRMRTWVVVTSQSAREVVATKTGLEVIPGVSIDKLFRYSEIVSEAPRTDMRTLKAAYLSENTQPVLARMEPRSRQVSANKEGQFGENPQMELSGAAVFKNDKMIGWLNLTESRGMLWFVEPVESRIVIVPCPDRKEQPISLELKHNKFAVTPHYNQGQVSFDVQLNTKIDMVEVGCSNLKSNHDLMNDLEPKAMQKLKAEIESAVKAAQQTYNSDFLELGKTFQNRYPQEWKQIKPNWSEVLARAKVNVHVKAQIKSPVLLQKPTVPGK